MHLLLDYFIQQNVEKQLIWYFSDKFLCSIQAKGKDENTVNKVIFHCSGIIFGLYIRKLLCSP